VLIEVLDGTPPGVQAFKAVGEVTVHDYKQVVEPAARSIIAAKQRIRVVFVIGPECTGYSRGAKLEDLKLGIADLRHLKRAAVVSDQPFVHNAVRKVRWMVPAKLKLFGLAQLNEAMRWAAS
jgi:hypothetical protein